MSGKVRLGVFVSVLWMLLVFVLAMSSAEVNGTPGFVTTLLVLGSPVWLGWGIAWVRSGFRHDRRARPGERGERQGSRRS